MTEVKGEGSKKGKKGGGFKKNIYKILPFPPDEASLFTCSSKAEIMIIMMMITTVSMVIIKSPRRVFAVIFNFFLRVCHSCSLSVKGG